MRTSQKKKDKSVNIQHPIPTNVHIQQQFDQLSAQIPSSQSSHSITSSPIPIHKNAECHASPGSPALKSLFRTLRVGSLKHQPGSPVNQPTLQEQTDILNQKSAINTSSIVRTASTSTFKPASVSSPCDTKPDYPNCINQLQSTAQMAVQSNLSSFTGTLSSPANQSSNAIVMRNNRLNMSQNSIKSNIVRGSKPCMSTFKEFHSENNSDGVKCRKNYKKTLLEISQLFNMSLTKTRPSANILYLKEVEKWLFKWKMKISIEKSISSKLVNF
ncbi:hypothetical protein BpHYR1_035365 [Brachionus plicatilis]|uniref:Uncharacterized protein n=1 Tax=Brachionus plicatilis TaxID=10195 RepID=A0A3M7S912_BRAPC|nr:hypothetical protein BpHYR1_035365 [Brachionus plicatilis]